MERVHTTENEMQFIDGLGKHSDMNIDRNDLLQGYLIGSIKRNDWAGMQKDLIIKYVRSKMKGTI